MQILQDVKLVIFDLDGVLVDSELLSFRAIEKELGKLGVVIDIEFFVRNFWGQSFSSAQKSVSEAFDYELSEDFVNIYRATLMENFKHNLKAIAHTQDVLTQLNTKTAVATGSSLQRATVSLQVSGLAPFFENTVFSASDLENPKPAPDIFLQVADVFGVQPSDCLVIEDSLSGITAANRANMKVWHFRGGSHFGNEYFKSYCDSHLANLRIDRAFDDMRDFFRG